MATTESTLAIGIIVYSDLVFNVGSEEQTGNVKDGVKFVPVWLYTWLSGFMTRDTWTVNKVHSLYITNKILRNLALFLPNTQKITQGKNTKIAIRYLCVPSCVTTINISNMKTNHAKLVLRTYLACFSRNMNFDTSNWEVVKVNQQSVLNKYCMKRYV